MMRAACAFLAAACLWFHAEDLASPLVHVSHDITHVLVRDHDLQLHYRFEQARLSF